MARVNRSISVPEDLSVLIDEAAAAEDVTPSAWLADAARRRLKIDQGIREIDEWFLDNGGPPTPEEDAAAEEFFNRALAANMAYRGVEVEAQDPAS